jgi:hypothetical protein
MNVPDYLLLGKLIGACVLMTLAVVVCANAWAGECDEL